MGSSDQKPLREREPEPTAANSGVSEGQLTAVIGGHELPEIDIAALGRQLLDELDLRILKQVLIANEQARLTKKEPIRES